MTPVRFLRSARDDLDRERSYYRRIDPVLVRRFAASVRAASQAISENALAMQVIESQVRRWPLSGFPHGIPYCVEPDFVLVLAVFHPKQNPEIWRSRVTPTATS